MTKKRRVYIDIEGNGLLDTVTKLWCLVAKDVDTGEVFTFHPTKSTACYECSGTGQLTKSEGVFRCVTCDGSGNYSGDHTQWQDQFKDFLEECELLIGHNILGYDLPVIEKVLGLKYPLTRKGELAVHDTLVWSKLFRPTSPQGGTFSCGSASPTDSNYIDNRVGGHSLGAWGKRLGYPKTSFDDWSRYSGKMLAYCINDVEVGVKIWEYLDRERQGLVDPLYLSGEISTSVPISDLSIRLEQSVASCLRQQELNGFKLDITATEKLRDDTEALLKDMNKDLAKHFPPFRKHVNTWRPKFKKDGTLTSVSERILMNKDVEPVPGVSAYVLISPITNQPANLVLSDGRDVYEEYDMFESVEFNPRSSQQKARVLMERGWVPKHFTPKGAPSTKKEHLAEAVDELSAKHPEISFLKDYSLVAFNNDKANKWLEIVQDDGRVHGKINHLGCSTHRCTHSDDNLANVASVKYGKDGILKGLEGEYGYDCRNCWSVEEGNVLVGADASSIQLRALAHYINDPLYTKEVCEGDIHVVNQKAAGIADRPTAKTFIYAWLLGAGDENIGQIVGVDPSEYDSLKQYGKDTKIYGKELLTYYIDKIRSQKRPATKEAVMYNLKGHKTKAQFLDRIPALKKFRTKTVPDSAKRGWVEGLDGRKIWVPSEHLTMGAYLQGFEAVIMKAAICCYHDELNKKGIPFKQVVFVHDEVQVECAPEHADIVGQAIVDGIKKAGRIFKSNCPLDGEYQVGKSWASTH
jgi:DNA polymerase-1